MHSVENKNMQTYLKAQLNTIKAIILKHVKKTQLGSEMILALKKLPKTQFGFETIFLLKKLLNQLPMPDYDFPETISLELTNACNLKCVHCPSHSSDFKEFRQKIFYMKYDIFNKLMEEIDSHGKRSLALHKDGEPLLHPDLDKFLKRVKLKVDHHVYLTTNVHFLTKKITRQILDAKIDMVNFSIGSASEEFYKKVRGKNFQKVLENIHSFLALTKSSDWKPHVCVQIIDLPEFPEMQKEIADFKEYWSNYDVNVTVWEKLNWGVLNSIKINIKRYPCGSLWKYLFVNADDTISPCCVDWRHDLIVGNAESQTLQEVWQSPKLKKLRRIHIQNDEKLIPICKNCNQWSHMSKTINYRS